MKSLFEGIEFLFVEILFMPLDFLRSLELESWWAANAINWLFVIICTVAMVYWIKQLQIFSEKGEDEQDTTAHSFLK